MKKVIIIQQSLRQYRMDFFIGLRESLYLEGIELVLVYGKMKKSNNLSGDEIDLEWGKLIRNNYIKIMGVELVWQPCLNLIKDADLIIVEDASRLLINYFIMLKCRFSKCKFAFWGHGRNLQDTPSSLKNKIRYLFLRKADRWFAYTSGVKHFLVSKNVPENKITVVQNSFNTSGLISAYKKVDNQELKKLKKDLKIKGERIAIFCGTMYPNKRIDFIIETCLRVKKNIPDFHIIFIGNGIEKDKIIRAATSNEWIHYVGPKFNEDKIKYFKLAKIQLMPSAVGLGILDSFAMETPIITTQSSFHGPEIEYLENGINGIITKDNIIDYSNSIINGFETNRFFNLKQGCKRSAKIYTIERMINNFKTGIESCLNLKIDYK